MKPWPLIVVAVLACSLEVVAQTAAPTQPISKIVDGMHAKWGLECQSVSAALASAKPEDAPVLTSKKDLSCTCIPQAVDAAFPAAERAGQITEGGYQSRMSGPFSVCMARTLRERMAAACDKGQDPFAGPGERSTPARTSARCTCARNELAKHADMSLAQASKESAARYEAQVAAASPGKPAPTPDRPVSVVDAVGNKCGAIE